MSDAAPVELSLNNITYKVGSEPLFCNLNARFSSGIIGIAGTNGSGKSSLLSLLGGIRRPHTGKVLLNTQSLYDDPSLKAHIGFVSATPFLYPYLTVYENLYAHALMRHLNPQQIAKQLPLVLHQCRLFDHQKVLFQRLSDGTKKRVMLATMLVHQPQLLILDEPCTGLCPSERQALWSVIKALSGPKRLIMFSTHHPQEVASLCDTLLILSQGQLKPYAGREQFSEEILTRAQPDEPEHILSEDQR